MWIGGLALGSVVPSTPTPSDAQRLTDLEVEVAALSVAVEELKEQHAEAQHPEEETWLVQPGRSGLSAPRDVDVRHLAEIRRRLRERRAPVRRPQPGSR
jgi:hypothetical protein